MGGGGTQTVKQDDPTRQPFQKDLYTKAKGAYAATGKQPTDIYAAPNAIQTGALDAGIQAAKTLNPAAATQPAQDALTGLFGKNGLLQTQANSMKFTPQTVGATPYSTQLGADDMTNYIEQFIAGMNPNPGGQNELMAAINAGLAPMQQYLEESVIPNAKLHMSERGTGADAYGIDIAQQIRDQYARPGTELAGRLAYEDYARRAQNDAERYNMQYRTGAEGAMQGREITSNQTTLGNELAQRKVEATNAAKLQAQKQKADFISQMAAATISGASTAPGVAQANAQAVMTPSQIMAALGGQQQAWDQEALNAGQAAPWAGLNDYASIIQSGPSNTVQTSSKQPGMSDIIQGGLGGGLMGLGAAGALGLSGATAGLGGAGIGALLPLLAMI